MQSQSPNLYIFDIETIAVDAKTLEALMPAEFDESKSRELPYELRNATPPVETNKTLAKGLEKALASGGPMLVEVAEQKYQEWKEQKAQTWRDVRQAKIDKWNDELLEKKLKWIDTACLRAETAIIPLICVHEPCGSIAVFFIGKAGEIDMPQISKLNPVKMNACKDERGLLRTFWRYVQGVLEKDIAAKFAGWNSSKPGGFDLAMIKRRCWINRVDLSAVRTHDQRGYADSSVWLDLVEVWACGDRMLYATADSVARALGCQVRKTDHGGNFGKKWVASKTEGIMYCMVDVLSEREMSNHMGFPTSGTEGEY